MKQEMEATGLLPYAYVTASCLGSELEKWSQIFIKGSMFHVGEVNPDLGTCNIFPEEWAPKFSNKNWTAELSLSLLPSPSGPNRVENTRQWALELSIEREN